MPVKVRCTSCDKVLTVPDAARGKAVKCPGCQERIAVPGGDSDSGSTKAPGKSNGDKPRKKPASKPSKPVDEEGALASFDLRKAEDTNARICFKCGFDMQYLDEEETECPECGYDTEAGGQGKKAQKRAMRGPDPADFYPGLAKGAWKFMLKNQVMAWRTNAYVLVCLLISMFCAFMYLWISAWPPRVFFALCFTVAFMVIPGWLWLLDIEIIQMTLEKKDKFKRFNFDFFLASAMGLMSLGWCVAIALPLMAVPLGIGFYLVYFMGNPPWVYGVCAGIGAIPSLWMLPVSMSHMAMVITLPGWMIWKVAPTSGRTFAPLSVWLMWLFLTTLPLTGALAVIGAVWGNDIDVIVSTMESNAKTQRDRLAAANAPKGKNAPPAADPSTIGTIEDVNLMPLIGPAIILVLMVLPVGFIALFNMRINGQFTYFNKTRLGLIDKRKEYKYVARPKRDEDDDEFQERTAALDAKEAAIVGAVFTLLGIVGGMLYGALSDVGVLAGMSVGALVGGYCCAVVGGFMVLGAAFSESVVWGLIYLFVPFGNLIYIIKFWDDARRGFLTSLIGSMICFTAFGLFLVCAVAFGIGAPPAPEAAPPAGGMQAPIAPPGGAAPAAVGAPPGAPAVAPMTAPPAVQREPFRSPMAVVRLFLDSDSSFSVGSEPDTGQRWLSA